MSFDISFIIATLNREDELIKLFKSLNKIKTNINFEVVVVDQGNSSFIKDFCSKNKFF